MNRPNLSRTWLLLMFLTWSASAVAQDAQPTTTPAATAPASTPAAAENAPTTDKPATDSPTIDPVVITAPPAAATTSATTTSATTTSATTTATPAAPAPRPAPPTTTATPPPAPEHEGRFVLMGVMEQRWNTHEGYDLFADDDVLTFLGVALGADVVSLGDRVTLAVELGWNTASTQRRDLLGGDIGRTELNIHHAQASLVARYAALPWLAPHARLTLGVSFLDMALQSNGDDRTFEDHTTSPTLGLGIGTSFQTPPGALSKSRGPLSHVQIGLRTELGYTLAGDAGFTLNDNGDLRVPSTATSLGGLARSGPSIHTAFFVRL